MPRKSETEAQDVASEFDNAHRFIKAWIEREAQECSNARKNGWHPPIGLIRTDTGKRILKLNDALLKAGEARGYVAILSEKLAPPLGFSIKGQNIIWRIREGYRRAKVPLDKNERKDPFNIAMGRKTKTVDTPSNTLVLFFKADYRVDQRLEDKPKKLLESKIDEILDKFDSAAKYAAARREEDNQAWRRRVDEQIHQARIRKVEAREERRWALLQEAAANKSAVKELRDTVAAIKQRMIDGQIDHPRTARWLDWAIARIDELDLLSKSPQEIFDHLIDRKASLELDFSEY
jgi:hypothetical protein